MHSSVTTPLPSQGTSTAPCATWPRRKSTALARRMSGQPHSLNAATATLDHLNLYKLLLLRVLLLVPQVRPLSRPRMTRRPFQLRLWAIGVLYHHRHGRLFTLGLPQSASCTTALRMPPPPRSRPTRRRFTSHPLATSLRLQAQPVVPTRRYAVCAMSAGAFACMVTLDGI